MLKVISSILGQSPIHLNRRSRPLLVYHPADCRSQLVLCYLKAVHSNIARDEKHGFQSYLMPESSHGS